MFLLRKIWNLLRKFKVILIHQNDITTAYRDLFYIALEDGSIRIYHT